MSQPPPTLPSRPADQAPEPGPGHDPVFAAVDGLVRDGTLDHTQADRVYAAMRATDTSATAPSTRGSFPTRLAASVALVGAGTSSGAALLAASLANLFEEGFDWQAFVVVGGVAGALLALTAASELVVHDRSGGRWFTAGPAGLAALALGLVAAVALLGEEAVDYVSGGVVMLAGTGLYAWLRTAPALAAAVVGGLVVVSAILDDTVAPDLGDEGVLGVGVGLVAYGVAVGGLGWLLPTRHVSAILGGLICLFGVLVVLVTGATAIVFAGFGGAGRDLTGDSATGLALGVLVCLGLLTLHVLTASWGYALLGTGGLVLVLPTGLYALDLEHTLRWSAGVGVIGVAIAAASGVLAARGGNDRSENRGR